MSKFTEEFRELYAVVTALTDANERLRTENWQLKQACGYPIPADKETINNPFQCGMCAARRYSPMTAQDDIVSPDIPKLLRAIAGGLDAREAGHDIILAAAADEIERLWAALEKYADPNYNGYNGGPDHARTALTSG